jgi:hypothetical protein
MRNILFEYLLGRCTEKSYMMGTTQVPTIVYTKVRQQQPLSGLDSGYPIKNMKESGFSILDTIFYQKYFESV